MGNYNVGDMIRLSRIAKKMTQEEFSKFFKGSPIKRAKLEGLARNAANTTID